MCVIVSGLFELCKYFELSNRNLLMLVNFMFVKVLGFINFLVCNYSRSFKQLLLWKSFRSFKKNFQCENVPGLLYIEKLLKGKRSS